MTPSFKFMKKRYFWTGTGLVLIVIAAVLSVKTLRGVSSSTPTFDNLKIKGPKNAPVHLVVYSDFQCPACKLAVKPIEDLRDQFGDSLKIEFRHYPLERPHKWALMAASFAQCAAEQNKFWEFHDRLFKAQETWSTSPDPVAFFAEIVQDLGLNTQQFESCIQNPATLAQVRKEQSLGNKQGVQSTPTIFINGQMLLGSIQLKEKGPGIITKELEKTKRFSF